MIAYLLRRKCLQETQHTLDVPCHFEISRKLLKAYICLSSKYDIMAEVKDKIFEKLKTIENEQFLNSILDLVQNVNNEGVYQLTSKQKADIDVSISQIENGEYLTHEEVMKKYLK